MIFLPAGITIASGGDAIDAMAETGASIFFRDEIHSIVKVVIIDGAGGLIERNVDPGVHTRKRFAILNDDAQISAELERGILELRAEREKPWSQLMKELFKD